MRDEPIPNDRRCPICGDLNVNPHQDSLCPRHHPAEDPEVTPLDATPEPSIAEARAVAGDEPASEPGDEGDVASELELIDEFERSNRKGSSDDDRDEADPDDASLLAAAMGDSEAAAAFQTDDDVEQREREPSTAGGMGMPTATLPLAQLDALDPAERRRAAKKRGLEWPTTDQARDRLEDTLHAVLRHEDDRVLDAPTSLGKTHTVAATRWGAREDLTGERPVVHLLETRDARDEAVEIAEEHGGEYLALEARHEACPVAAGDYDPPAAEDAEDELDYEPITIGGQAASEWLEEMCDGRGVHFSAAHRHLHQHNDQGRDLPCTAEGKCDAIAQWDHYREGPAGDREYWPLVIATHNFAYAPGLRMANNVVIDEEPDYLQELSTDRVRRAVGAYLRHIDAPVQTWEAFITATRGQGEHRQAAREHGLTEREYRESRLDDLEAALDREPDRGWYFQEPDAHMLAPALARAVFHAENRSNGRRVGKTPYEPPRLDAQARDDESWNREWVTVVLDENNEIRSVRVVPDFNAARSVVGLDAHPALPKWQANTLPWMQPKQVLGPEERQLWRRYERGLRVVQVGDATRPLASGEYFDYDGTQAVVEQLVDEYGGDTLRTAITADAVEDDLADIMATAGIRDPDTMHYGEEKSRNDFADEGVGFVLGSIDPGDDHVLDLLAELDLEAEPERSDPEAVDEAANAECEHCGGDGCQECLGTGLKRAQGRGFVGADAETAGAILASVRENHTAQAAGRYARNPDDSSSTATVFVRTDAMPPGFADVQVPGVTWTYSDKQERIVEVLRERDQQLTAREIATSADVSKRHVHRTLKRLVEYDVVDALEGRGPNGATLYSDAGVPPSGVVDVQDEDGQVATGHVLDSYTWAVAIDDPAPGPDDQAGRDDGELGDQTRLTDPSPSHAPGEPPD